MLLVLKIRTISSLNPAASCHGEAFPFTLLTLSAMSSEYSGFTEIYKACCYKHSRENMCLHSSPVGGKYQCFPYFYIFSLALRPGRISIDKVERRLMARLCPTFKTLFHHCISSSRILSSSTVLLATLQYLYSNDHLDVTMQQNTLKNRLFVILLNGLRRVTANPHSDKERRTS